MRQAFQALRIAFPLLLVNIIDYLIFYNIEKKITIEQRNMFSQS